jgi:type IV pilus assembly protein PilO
MTLDDLKNIDINNLGSWPVPIKIGGILVVCAIVLFAGFWFLIQGELEQYSEAQLKEEGLRETYMNK